MQQQERIRVHHVAEAAVQTRREHQQRLTWPRHFGQSQPDQGFCTVRTHQWKEHPLEPAQRSYSAVAAHLGGTFRATASA
jgi:hypothetical protein